MNSPRLPGINSNKDSTTKIFNDRILELYNLVGNIEERLRAAERVFKKIGSLGIFVDNEGAIVFPTQPNRIRFFITSDSVKGQIERSSVWEDWVEGGF